MSFDDKVNEFLEKIEHEKIMIETQFADIESYIKDHDDIDYDKLVSILSHFNTLNIQYEQLCHDLTIFISIFKSKEEQQIRIYKTEDFLENYQLTEENSLALYSKIIKFLEETKVKELVELLEAEVNKINNQ